MAVEESAGKKSVRIDEDSSNISTKPSQPDPANDATDEPSGDELGVEVKVEHAVKKKKKKSKSRSASKRGLNAPDGFEEFFADAPMTAEEFAADQEQYSPELPFIDRVLAAVQRFERTRKMSSERRNIFYKYLAYGGIDISPNMFQSAAGLDRSTMTKDELAVALSQVSIGTDTYDLTSPNALYTVDFVACAKGFLSRHSAMLSESDTHNDFALITTTVERFMDYLLQHNVCPEYEKEVFATRDLCRSAASELWACRQAFTWLPGDFNKACSTLFGGIYAKNYDGISKWNTETTDAVTFVGISQKESEQIINLGVAGAATEAVYHKYFNMVNSSGDEKLKVVSTKKNVGFTITKIFQPTKECINLYKSQTTEGRPVGRVVTKPWQNPDSAPEDLTDEEKAALETSFSPTSSPSRSSPLGTKISDRLTDLSKPEEYIFFIDIPIITHLRVGMHMEATVYELNCGIFWFDDLRDVFPSFDVFLLNDLMLGWKEPRWVKGSVEYEKQEMKEEEERLERERKEEQEKMEKMDNGHGGDADVNDEKNEGNEDNEGDVGKDGITIDNQQNGFHHESKGDDDDEFVL
jgi:hypothetical protein